MIPDFQQGRLLHLSGRAQLHWEQADPQGLTGGSGRFWEFEIEHWVLREQAMPLRWEFLDASPFNPKASP